MLYFHRFIIIFKLALQQWFLWINWTKLKTFVQKLCVFSIPFAFENVYQQLVMKKEHLTIYCFKKSLPSVLKTWQVLISRKKFFWEMSKYRNTVFYDFKFWFLVIFSSNYRHRNYGHLVLDISFPDHIFPKIPKYRTKNLHFLSTCKYYAPQLRLVSTLPAKMKVLLIVAEKLKLNFSQCALFHMKTRFSLKYFVSYFDSNLPQAPSNLISLIFLVTLRPFSLFQPKIRDIKWQKSLKICLTW